METIEKLSREKLPKITVLAGEDLGQYSQAKEKFLKLIIRMLNSIWKVCLFLQMKR